MTPDPVDILFGPDPTDRDHRGYETLRNSARPEFRIWCEHAYSRFKGQLDPDFANRFRRDLPKRLSELFFAAAFAEAGWQPVDPETGFDFAYKWGAHRLLIEVTTPDAPPEGCYQTEEINGQIHYSGDERTLEATLLRLTGGFFAKANRIARIVAAKPSLARDYKVIALSGFDIGQNMPFPPSASGQVPDFIRGFLPIGPMFVRFPIGEPADSRPLETGYNVSSTILKESGGTVDRTAFLDPKFAHVDAIAYTPLNLLGLGSPATQVGVLHNALSVNARHAPHLGMGSEYRLSLAEDTFELTRETENVG